jgi:hypothetical protein
MEVKDQVPSFIEASEGERTKKVYHGAETTLRVKELPCAGKKKK